MWELKGLIYEAELTQVALRGDVDLLRQKLASLEQHHKGMLTCPAGRHRLRYLASAAAFEGKREIVEYLIKERGVPINTIDNDLAGWKYDKDMTVEKNASLTPLIAAIAGEHEDLALALLVMGKVSGEGMKADVLDLGRPFPSDSGTLGHYAAEHGQVRVLEALIERDAVLLDISDDDGHTPLCRAIEHGHHNVISTILSHYMSKERLQHVYASPCNNNLSVLGHAINGTLNGGPEKEEELAELLRMLVMEWGANVGEIFSIRLQMMPNLELSILHLAAIQEWSHVIELIVDELDAPIDTLTPITERTLLHCACMSTLLTRVTALEFITWMVDDVGAHIFILSKDSAGLTASQYADMNDGEYAREVRDYLRRKEKELTPPTEEEAEEEAFLLEGAPAEYKDVFSLGLMQSSPVTASDGYVYERQSLERWIRTCEEEGNALTSPRTGAGMAALFLPNLTHRTLVRDWVEKRKAEWGKRKTEEGMDVEDQEEEGGVHKRTKQLETAN